MAHFAKIENDTVTQVIYVANEHEAAGQDYLNSIGLEGEWIQTSYNNNIRGVYAAIGYSYDRELDKFIPAQPFPSWTFDETQWGWVAPVAMPDSDEEFEWNEDSGSWVKV